MEDGTTVKFLERDRRELIEVLIQAVEITEIEEKPPQVVVGGRVYQSFDLISVAALLPYDEPLLPHHQEKVDALFKKPQHGYGRTASNLAMRALRRAADIRKRKATARDHAFMKSAMKSAKVEGNEVVKITLAFFHFDADISKARSTHWKRIRSAIARRDKATDKGDDSTLPTYLKSRANAKRAFLAAITTAFERLKGDLAE